MLWAFDTPLAMRFAHKRIFAKSAVETVMNYGTTTTTFSKNEYWHLALNPPEIVLPGTPFNVDPSTCPYPNENYSTDGQRHIHCQTCLNLGGRRRSGPKTQNMTVVSMSRVT